MTEGYAKSIGTNDVPREPTIKRKRQDVDDNQRCNYNIREPRHLKNLSGYFICSFQHFRRFLAAMNHHQEFCRDGKVSDRTTGYILCGLAGTVKFHCHLGSKCKAWRDGNYLFESDDMIDGNGYQDYASNIKSAYALINTPAMRFTHMKMFCQAINLSPRCFPNLLHLIRTAIDPYLNYKFDEIIESNIESSKEKYNDSGVQLMADSSFDSPRNARTCITAVMNKDQLIVGYEVNTDQAPAVTKELTNTTKLLNTLIEKNGLNVYNFTTDSNRSVQNFVEGCSNRSGAIKAGSDPWHVEKGLPLKVSNQSSSLMKSIQSFLFGKMSTASRYKDAARELVGPFCDQLIDNFRNWHEDYKVDNLFKEFKSSRTDKFADAFKKIKNSKKEEDKWRNSHSLNYWEDRQVLAIDDGTLKKVLAAYGHHKKVSYITQVRLSKSSPTVSVLKELYGIITGKVLTEAVKITRDEMIKEIAPSLPSVCTKHWSISFEDCTDTIKSALVALTDDGIKQLSQSSERKISAAKEIFGKKFKKNTYVLPSLNQLAICKQVGKKLAAFSEFDSSVLGDDLKAWQGYIYKNISTIYTDEYMIEQGIKLGKDAFEKRVPSIKKQYSHLCRLASQEYFVGYCDRFRKWWVVEGLLNYIDHWMDDHSSCSRFLWYCRCGFGHHATGGEHTDLYYVPDELPYITELASGQHPHIDEIAKLYFRLFATAFILSEENEHIVAKIVDGDATSCLESLFHEIWCSTPKCFYYPEEEMKRRQKANIIRYDGRRKQAINNQYEFTVQKQKYTGDSMLIHKRHNILRGCQQSIIDFQKAVLYLSKSTMVTCASDQVDLNRSIEKRKARIRNAETKFWNDDIAQNFNTKLCLKTTVDTMDLDDHKSCKWISIFPFPLFVYEDKMEMFECMLLSYEAGVKEVDNFNDHLCCDVCKQNITNGDDDDEEATIDKTTHMPCGGSACTLIVCKTCIDSSSQSNSWLIDDTDSIYLCNSCKDNIIVDDVILGSRIEKNNHMELDVYDDS